MAFFSLMYLRLLVIRHHFNTLQDIVVIAAFTTKPVTKSYTARPQLKEALYKDYEQ